MLPVTQAAVGVASLPPIKLQTSLLSRILRHDNDSRLAKLYAWEEKKSKASWRAQIVDYEKIAAAAVQAMKAADLNRFLVICALVPDLYCPGYNPRQSLEKSSNLARAAIRYKVDPAKVATAVRTELSKPAKKVKRQNQPANEPIAATGQQAKDRHRKQSK